MKISAGQMKGPSQRSRIDGCLLGGAVGDALGAPIEFLSAAEIRRRYGPAMVRGYVEKPDERGRFTDDTQMSLFTAEGLIRALNRSYDRGLCNIPAVLVRAYHRWLSSQDIAPPDEVMDVMPREPAGWLSEVNLLHRRRSPGTTCLSALQSEECGSRQRPINNSKGCGGVMRIAPVGLVQEHPFDLAADIAAITHGNPTGYLAAATFAEVIASLYRGLSLPSAVYEARKQLEEVESSAETVSAVDSAIAAAEKLPATPEAVESLGTGWVAEEALAIALFCSLKANDFASGVLLAVNHGGDSDSTGSLTGNLLGTIMGVESIPAEWVDNLEGYEIIEEVARDLWLHFVEPPTWLDPSARVTEESRRLGEAEFQRYPPW